MAVLNNAYFVRLRQLAESIKAYRTAPAEEEELALKRVGKLLARWEAQIVANITDDLTRDEYEKYGKEEFERANGYAYEEAANHRQPDSGESEEVRDGEGID